MNMALNMALAGTGFAPFDLPPLTRNRQIAGIRK